MGRPELEAAARRRLRRDEPTLLADDREPLLVCAECGEIGCGAITARITARRGLVTWSDLGWQTDWGDPDVDPGIGPFHFEWRAYRATLA